MSEIALRVQNVQYQYPKSQDWVLQNLNLEIPKKKVWLIVGPTGSGKSTLLALTRGFHKQYGGVLKGKIWINGIDQDQLRFEDLSRMGIGWVGQDPTLGIHQLTVRDEVLSSPIYLNLPWEDCVSLASRIMNALGISHLAHRSPSELSGGQMQRVAIAAALTMSNYGSINDKLLLLDEPDSFLDFQARKDLIEIISDVRRTGTVIIAAHQIDHYLPIADGITLVVNGQVAISGSPRDVLYSKEYSEKMTLPWLIQITKKLREKDIISSHPITSAELYDSLNIPKPAECSYMPRSLGADEPAVQYSDVSYSYPDGTSALDGITLTLPKHALIGVIGPNGAGKSSLAKLTINLFDKYRGSIKLLGRELRQYTTQQIADTVSFITQNPKEMFITGIVREEAELLPKTRGSSNPRKKALEALHKAGLDDLANSSVDTLSGGQSRMLTLASTVFVSDSKIIILDEPEYGIDLGIQETLLNYISQLRAEGKTVIILTHNLDMTLLCDYIVLMAEGKIIKMGHPSEIYEDQAMLQRYSLDQPQLYSIFREAWKHHSYIKNIDVLLHYLLAALQSSPDDGYES